MSSQACSPSDLIAPLPIFSSSLLFPLHKVQQRITFGRAEKSCRCFQAPPVLLDCPSDAVRSSLWRASVPRHGAPKFRSAAAPSRIGSRKERDGSGIKKEKDKSSDTSGERVRTNTCDGGRRRGTKTRNRKTTITISAMTPSLSTRATGETTYLSPTRPHHAVMGHFFS